MMKQRKVFLAKPKPTAGQKQRKPLVEPRRTKPKTKHQAPIHLWKFYEGAVIESEARTTAVRLTCEA